MEDLLWDFINRVIRNIIFETFDDLLQELEKDERSAFVRDLWELMVKKHGNPNDDNLQLEKFDCTKHEITPEETIYIFHFPVEGIEEPVFFSALYLKKLQEGYNKRYFKFEKRDEDSELVQLCEWIHRPTENPRQKDIMLQKVFEKKYNPQTDEFIAAIENIIRIPD